MSYRDMRDEITTNGAEFPEPETTEEGRQVTTGKDAIFCGETT